MEQWLCCCQVIVLSIMVYFEHPRYFWPTGFDYRGFLHMMYTCFTRISPSVSQLGAHDNGECSVTLQPWRP